MGAGVMLVKSFSAGIGDKIINRLQVAFYRPARRFYIFSHKDTERTEHKFAFIYPCKFALYPYN